MSDVTRILSQIESGDPSAAEKLLPLVYDEQSVGVLIEENVGRSLTGGATVGKEVFGPALGEQLSLDLPDEGWRGDPASRCFPGGRIWVASHNTLFVAIRTGS